MKTIEHNIPCWSKHPIAAYYFQQRVELQLDASTPAKPSYIETPVTCVSELRDPVLWNLLYILTPPGTRETTLLVAPDKAETACKNLKGLLLQGLPLRTHMQFKTPQQFIELFQRSGYLNGLDNPGYILRVMLDRVKHLESSDG